ncbi:hypothetical protein N7456_008024 [Penicillium angulare]|uniref:Uncharacterized protein n=1 Tax=Penicillium angulare TaxID=116970 RepID=A0A9W9K8U7_9EURO|nr:hypothetical protein N7456_008024 [Penicillium angulare]
MLNRSEKSHSNIMAKLQGKDMPLAPFEFEHLASYTALKSPTPTIVIPGCPAKWNPAAERQRLDRDGEDVRPNLPNTMEPLFRAISIEGNPMNQTHPFIVTDNCVLRRLLDCVSYYKRSLSGRGQSAYEEWTLDTEVSGGETVVFRHFRGRRKDERPSYGRDISDGFGRNFEKANTVNTIEESLEHQRIIRYRLGGVAIIARYEADGFVEDDSGPKEKKDSPADESVLPESAPSLASAEMTTTSTGLRIQKDGQKVSPGSIIEMKTRTRVESPYTIRTQAGSPCHFEEFASQLWFSRVTNLVFATHSDGRFDPPQVEDVSESLKEWQEGNKDILDRLACGLNRLSLILRYVPIFKGATITFKGKSLEIKGHEWIYWMLPRDLYGSIWDEDRMKAKECHGRKCFDDVKSVSILYSQLFSLEPVTFR